LIGLEGDIFVDDLFSKTMRIPFILPFMIAANLEGRRGGGGLGIKERGGGGAHKNVAKS
jgi:hypothetical protein